MTVSTCTSTRLGYKQLPSLDGAKLSLSMTSSLGARTVCYEPATNLLQTCYEPAANLLRTCYEPATKTVKKVL